MIPSVLIRTLLSGANLGEVESLNDWSLWIGGQPTNKPIRCVAIYDSGGLAPDPKWRLDNPSIQVRVRGGVNDYEEAFKKAKELSNFLVGIESQDVTEDRLVAINAIGDVAYIGRDDKNQPEFVFNLRLITEPGIATVTNREPL